jgi:hypothetical protein
MLLYINEENIMAKNTRKTPQKAIWINEEMHKEFSEWAASEHRTAKAQFELLWKKRKKN